MRSSLAISLLFLAACSSAEGPERPAAGEPVADAGAPAPAPETVSEPAPPKDAGSDAAPPPPSGCGRAVSGVGALTERSLKALGKDRTFHLSIPAGYDPKTPHALLFVLHGATDTTPQYMRDWFPVEGGMTDVIAVYPQALVRTRPDGSGGAVTRWDLYGDEDTAFFDAVLAEIASTHCVDRGKVFATGFSSGGNFAHQLACLRSSAVRAIGPVAGPGPFTDKCGGPVAVWMTHDVDDQGLSVVRGRAIGS